MAAGMPCPPLYLMSSDPRVHKPRLPKAYTDPQITYLKSNLVEFERRSQGSIRGDAKKFALERAADFIARFGLPDEFIGTEESESRFREQIYNWFKNTVGRTRRKLEGRPRSSKKAAEKAAQSQTDLTWNTNVATPTIIPYTQGEGSSSISPSSSIPVQYGGIQASSSVATSLAPAPTGHTHPLNLNVSTSAIREAFLQGVDSSTLSSMIQSYTISYPSPTPLTAVVDALFHAISSPESSHSSQRTPFSADPYTLIRRYLDASTYFAPSVVHAGVSGPLAGPRALQMRIRKHSTWIPNPGPPSSQTHSPTPSYQSSSSMTDEMQRIASDRQRRKDYIQWARIHAAALELGMPSVGHVGDSDNNGYAYAMGRAFSEMMATDAVWEEDEVEWVAGIFVLRAVIRTAIGVDRRKREEYAELLRTYERRWKEIKDEARQALVTEVLLGAKDDLARLDDSLS